MPGVWDRMTVNFSTQKGLELAARFRKLVGSRNINKTLIMLIEEYTKRIETLSGMSPKK